MKLKPPKERDPASQNAMILAALKRGERVTPLEALAKYGCFRLAARIYELRRDGHSIGCDRVEQGTKGLRTKHVAEYFLIHTKDAA